MESAHLTLPERFALSDPNSQDGLMALRLTLLEWLIRGLISLESRVRGQSSSRLWTGNTAHSEDWFTLQDGATATHYAQGTEAIIVTALRQAGREGQTHPLPHAAYFLREAFGVDYSEFHRRGLLPERILVHTEQADRNAAYWYECNIAIDLLRAEIADDPENWDGIAALAVRARDALFFCREMDSHLILVAKAVRTRAPQQTELLLLWEPNYPEKSEITKWLNERMRLASESNSSLETL